MGDRETRYSGIGGDQAASSRRADAVAAAARRFPLARSPTRHPLASAPDRGGLDERPRLRTSGPESRVATITSRHSTSRSGHRCGESGQTPAPAGHQRSLSANRPAGSRIARRPRSAAVLRPRVHRTSEFPRTRGLRSPGHGPAPRGPHAAGRKMSARPNRSRRASGCGGSRAVSGRRGHTTESPAPATSSTSTASSIARFFKRKNSPAAGATNWPSIRAWPACYKENLVALETPDP